MSLWQLSRENSEDQLSCSSSSADLGPVLVDLAGAWSLTLPWVSEVDVHLQQPDSPLEAIWNYRPEFIYPKFLWTQAFSL